MYRPGRYIILSQTRYCFSPGVWHVWRWKVRRQLLRFMMRNVATLALMSISWIYEWKIKWKCMTTVCVYPFIINSRVSNILDVLKYVCDYTPTHIPRPTSQHFRVVRLPSYHHEQSTVSHDKGSIIQPRLSPEHIRYINPSRWWLLTRLCTIIFYYGEIL